MKKYVAFCSLLAFVIFAVTAGGIVIFAILFFQWRDGLEEALLPPSEEQQEVVANVIDQQPEYLSAFSDIFDGSEEVTFIGDEVAGQFVYQILVHDETYVVAWGVGAIAVPEGVTQISTGDLEPGLERAWATVAAEDQLYLSEERLLLR